LNKIQNNYSNSVALDGNPEPEPEIEMCLSYMRWIQASKVDTESQFRHTWMVEPPTSIASQ
jgi:hypothetical protein